MSASLGIRPDTIVGRLMVCGQSCSTSDALRAPGNLTFLNSNNFFSSNGSVSLGIRPDIEDGFGEMIWRSGSTIHTVVMPIKNPRTSEIDDPKAFERVKRAFDLPARYK